jgi:DNA-binding CsgD family transcriptional regulator
MAPFQIKELSVYKAHDGSWMSSVAVQALDHLNAGTVVTDSCVEVIDINPAAESIVRLQDGLLIRNDRLCARRVFETTRLTKLVAGVTAAGKPRPAAVRMLVAGCKGLSPYVLTIAPLRTHMVVGERRLALIVVVDPDQHSPSEKDLAEFFGLSRAEARLAAALLTGKTVAHVAANTGVRVTTLRTQLRSIMRKAGAQRQSDLIRILSSTGIGSLSCLVGWLDAGLEVLQIPVSFACI